MHLLIITVVFPLSFLPQSPELLQHSPLITLRHLRMCQDPTYTRPHRSLASSGDSLLAPLSTAAMVPVRGSLEGAGAKFRPKFSPSLLIVVVRMEGIWKQYMFALGLVTCADIHVSCILLEESTMSLHAHVYVSRS